MTTDNRIYAPATTRNRDAIYDCLKDHLPKSGSVLEIASGSGEHAAHLCPLFPEIMWQATNFDPQHLKSAIAWQEHCALQNFLPVMELDATASVWPTEDIEYPHAPFDAMFNANMIHISPWVVCEGLFAGAARSLKAGGMMFLYGPFKLDGEQTAPSNVKFEQWLKDIDLSFGVRDLEDVKSVAVHSGFSHLESCPMPANNFLQIFSKN